ncbi:MAG: hypothetical protein UT13_C0001G0123 [Candidatus Pacebacteria bacterium GW2011_GWF2_38_9]|nr:MAG: hypothetical protein US01_C0001G0123 [candidate division TM6 bacterium GW2011_GWF2_28_16]KKQ88476.1 MAG: hypothetical protein UT13_C0001G0123 [Candidatus Pacebacteria bacterium GW2011_GWF2_38_9]HAZ73389.1 hypothetical protein [Candidatus Paceibacterota bacterium]
MELQKNADWYQYLDECQKELVVVSFSLLNKKEALADLKDYSFIVFSMAKAYEGFLKKVFFDLYLINKETYEGRRFRIGRALNPDIRDNQRDQDWLYDDVAHKFGKEIARQLWDTWLVCRNRVFHYFSDCTQFLSFDEAAERVKMMEEAMQLVTNQLKK